MKLVIDFILVGGMVLTMSMLFLLVKSKNKELQRRVLVVFYIFIFFVNLHAYALLHNLSFLFSASFIIDFCTFWFLGPLLYLYIQSVFETDKGLVKGNLVHFIPCLLFAFFIGIPFNFTLFIESFKPSYLSFLEQNQLGIVVFRNLYFAYYVRRSLQSLKTYSVGITSNYSNLSNRDIEWIEKLLYGCLIFISIDILSRLFNFIDTKFFFDVGFITILSINTLIAYLGYYGINQSKILLPDFLTSTKGSEVCRQPNSLSSYNSGEIMQLRQKLDQALSIQKVYLDENLTLGVLASEIGISDKKLSTLLNVHLDTTFYDHVNLYRVEAVKEMLVSDQYKKYTLLAIAHECGFNSKASFNRVFKKETGQSPSQFKKSI